MKKNLAIVSGFVLSLTAPVVVLAQTVGTSTVSQCNPTIQTLGDMLCKVSQLLSSVIPVLIALAVVYFVWGVVTYVIASDEEAKKTGRNRIIYGIIGLAVIIALWGLVGILVRTFGLTNNSNITLPTVPYQNY